MKKYFHLLKKKNYQSSLKKHFLAVPSSGVAWVSAKFAAPLFRYINSKGSKIYKDSKELFGKKLYAISNKILSPLGIFLGKDINMTH